MQRDAIAVEYHVVINIDFLGMVLIIILHVL